MSDVRSESLTDSEIRQLMELARETMSTRELVHVDQLVAALQRDAKDEELWLQGRRSIYRGLCFAVSQPAADALLSGLQNDEEQAVRPIIEGIWKHKRVLQRRLPNLLLEHYGTDEGDSRFAERIITILKRHRVLEKIGTDWLADAPPELEQKLTPQPLWL